MLKFMNKIKILTTNRMKVDMNLVYKRTIKDLLTLLNEEFMEYYILKSNEFISNIVTRDSMDLDTVIDADYLAIRVESHDDACILMSFNENELDYYLKDMKELFDNIFVDDQWIIYKNKILYKTCFEINSNEEYECVFYDYSKSE